VEHRFLGEFLCKQFFKLDNKPVTLMNLGGTVKATLQIYIYLTTREVVVIVAE